ncbi:MAG TPA: lysylphosphatidylglycerol synthase transmembrane domain-containing protein [Pyrinomonadaceae bacterium]|nr:lysylphosphatidylglycerol synthase transmembrane domain-containing protein [Pyrinomonadaceae bacterium]
MGETPQKKTKKFTPAGIVFAVLGVLLFAYFVKKAGVAEIVDGIKRLGAGFLLVLLISSIRPTVRSITWTLCFEPPYTLSFFNAFRAYLIGDAIGTLVPLGIVVSEPAKAALVRERVPFTVGFSALVVENLFYSLSVALFILLGTLALILSFPLPKPLWILCIGALSGVIVLIFVAYFVIRRKLRFASAALEFLYGRGIARPFLETKRERTRTIEDRIYGFYDRNSSRFLPILLLEFCFHLAGVAEVYVTLFFISDLHPTLLSAFILESVNRFINVAFKFIPLRVGIDEAGTGLLAKILQFGTASGVTLAIIRKARIFCWTALGVAFLVRRGLSLKAITEETEAAMAQARDARPS